MQKQQLNLCILFKLQWVKVLSIGYLAPSLASLAVAAALSEDDNEIVDPLLVSWTAQLEDFCPLHLLSDKVVDTSSLQICKKFHCLY